MKADIASIKQHQARHLVSSDVIQLLKSENMALKAEVESWRRGLELKLKLNLSLFYHLWTHRFQTTQILKQNTSCFLLHHIT